MLWFSRLLESKSCNFTKFAQNELAKSLAKNYFYSYVELYSNFYYRPDVNWSADFGSCPRSLLAVQGSSASRSLPCGRRSGSKVATNAFAGTYLLSALETEFNEC